jgi:hypothetical protein
MAKKTSVVLPGSLKNLVNSVQKGDAAVSDESPKAEKSPVQEQMAPEAPVQQAVEEKKPAPANPEETYKNDMASGVDSWQIFLDMARDYKQRDTSLATIYIDGDLKDVLDRMRTARSIKLPTASILSSIVAKFIFEHEEEIKKAVFGNLL